MDPLFSSSIKCHVCSHIEANLPKKISNDDQVFKYCNIIFGGCHADIPGSIQFCINLLQDKREQNLNCFRDGCCHRDISLELKDSDNSHQVSIDDALDLESLAKKYQSPSIFPEKVTSCSKDKRPGAEQCTTCVHIMKHAMRRAGKFAQKRTSACTNVCSASPSFLTGAPPVHNPSATTLYELFKDQEGVGPLVYLPTSSLYQHMLMSFPSSCAKMTQELHSAQMLGDNAAYLRATYRKSSISFKVADTLDSMGLDGSFCMTREDREALVPAMIACMTANCCSDNVFMEAYEEMCGSSAMEAVQQQVLDLRLYVSNPSKQINFEDKENIPVPSKKDSLSLGLILDPKDLQDQIRMIMDSSKLSKVQKAALIAMKRSSGSINGEFSHVEGFLNFYSTVVRSFKTSDYLNRLKDSSHAIVSVSQSALAASETFTLISMLNKEVCSATQFLEETRALVQLNQRDVLASREEQRATCKLGGLIRMNSIANDNYIDIHEAANSLFHKIKDFYPIGEDIQYLNGPQHRSSTMCSVVFGYNSNFIVMLEDLLTIEELNYILKQFFKSLYDSSIENILSSFLGIILSSVPKEFVKNFSSFFNWLSTVPSIEAMNKDDFQKATGLYKQFIRRVVISERFLKLCYGFKHANSNELLRVVIEEKTKEVYQLNFDFNTMIEKYLSGFVKKFCNEIVGDLPYKAPHANSLLTVKKRIKQESMNVQAKLLESSDVDLSNSIFEKTLLENYLLEAAVISDGFSDEEVMKLSDDELISKQKDIISDVCTAGGMIGIVDNLDKCFETINFSKMVAIELIVKIARDEIEQAEKKRRILSDKLAEATAVYLKLGGAIFGLNGISYSNCFRQKKPTKALSAIWKKFNPLIKANVQMLVEAGEFTRRDIEENSVKGSTKGFSHAVLDALNSVESKTSKLISDELSRMDSAAISELNRRMNLLPRPNKTEIDLNDERLYDFEVKSTDKFKHNTDIYWEKELDSDRLRDHLIFKLSAGEQRLLQQTEEARTFTSDAIQERQWLLLLLFVGIVLFCGLLALLSIRAVLQPPESYEFFIDKYFERLNKQDAHGTASELSSSSNDNIDHLNRSESEESYSNSTVHLDEKSLGMKGGPHPAHRAPPPVWTFERVDNTHGDGVSPGIPFRSFFNTLKTKFNNSAIPQRSNDNNNIDKNNLDLDPYVQHEHNANIHQGYLEDAAKQRQSLHYGRRSSVASNFNDEKYISFDMHINIDHLPTSLSEIDDSEFKERKNRILQKNVFIKDFSSDEEVTYLQDNDEDFEIINSSQDRSINQKSNIKSKSKNKSISFQNPILNRRGIRTCCLLSPSLDHLGSANEETVKNNSEHLSYFRSLLEINNTSNFSTDIRSPLLVPSSRCIQKVSFMRRSTAVLSPSEFPSIDFDNQTSHRTSYGGLTTRRSEKLTRIPYIPERTFRENFKGEVEWAKYKVTNFLKKLGGKRSTIVNRNSKALQSTKTNAHLPGSSDRKSMVKDAANHAN